MPTVHLAHCDAHAVLGPRWPAGPGTTARRPFNRRRRCSPCPTPQDPSRSPASAAAASQPEQGKLIVPRPQMHDLPSHDCRRPAFHPEDGGVGDIRHHGCVGAGRQLPDYATETTATSRRHTCEECHGAGRQRDVSSGKPKSHRLGCRRHNTAVLPDCGAARAAADASGRNGRTLRAAARPCDDLVYRRPAGHLPGDLWASKRTRGLRSGA